MAEKGAHVSASLIKKPSIFELIAQDNLANTFYPALNHVANYLVTRNPVKYAFLQEWFEELYLAFQILVQTHYLRNYDATFSEKFYTLKRIRINLDSKNSSTKLSVLQKILSLLFAVILPYFRNKLRIMVQNFENDEEYRNKLKVPREYRSTVIQFYKTCHFVTESFCMLYYIQYMTGRSETHSLFLQLMDITLVYFHEEPKKQFYWKAVMKDILSGNLRSFVHLLRLIKGSFGYSLEIFAFFIQFLNWWHSEQLHAKFFAYPIPAAPQSKLANDTDQFKNTCPLCKKPFKIPTAVPVSGYVYCFICIRKYVAMNRRCPVTNLPTIEDDLIRIYVNDSSI